MCTSLLFSTSACTCCLTKPRSYLSIIGIYRDYKLFVLHMLLQFTKLVIWKYHNHTIISRMHYLKIDRNLSDGCFSHFSTHVLTYLASGFLLLQSSFWMWCDVFPRTIKKDIRIKTDFIQSFEFLSLPTFPEKWNKRFVLCAEFAEHTDYAEFAWWNKLLIQLCIVYCSFICG